MQFHYLPEDQRVDPALVIPSVSRARTKLIHAAGVLGYCRTRQKASSSRKRGNIRNSKVSQDTNRLKSHLMVVRVEGRKLAPMPLRLLEITAIQLQLHLDLEL